MPISQGIATAKLTDNIPSTNFKWFIELQFEYIYTPVKNATTDQAAEAIKYI